MAKLSEEETARRATNRRRRAAVLAEEEDARQTRKSQEWVANGTYLSREELEARVPCRGCGQPIIDGLGGWPPLMKLDDEQKRDHEPQMLPSSLGTLTAMPLAGAWPAPGPPTARSAVLPHR